MPRASLGFTLQSFPLPRSRAAFRRPSASLRVRRRPCLIRREDPPAVRPVSAAFRSEPRPLPPLAERRGARRGNGVRDFPRSSRPPFHRASRPTRRPDGRQVTFGLAGTRPFRPLRSLAPPGSPFTRPTALSRETCASRALTADRAGALLGFAPPEPSPPRPRVRSTATTTRFAPSDRGSLAPLPDGGGVGSDPEAMNLWNQRSSGWPPGSLHRRTLRASAPPYGSAPSSRALHRSARP
jgi:hypothetical protein